MTLPDDAQHKQKTTDGSLSSGGEEPVLGGVGGGGVDNNQDLQQPVDDVPPPAGYQLLSPNNAIVPQHHSNNDDSSDFEASTDSDDPPPPHGAENGGATSSTVVHMTVDWNDVEQEDDKTKPQEQLEDTKQSNFERHTRQEVGEVWWSFPTSDSLTTPIQAEHCDKIKECLSSFQLPAENIPAWAQHVQEGEWKDVLLERLKKINQQKN